MQDIDLDTSWIPLASCRGLPTAWWYPDPESEVVSQTHMARQVCGRCPVLGECVEYAVEMRDEEGLWGGMSHRRRQAFVRARRRAGGALEVADYAHGVGRLRAVCKCAACKLVRSGSPWQPPLPLVEFADAVPVAAGPRPRRAVRSRRARGRSALVAEGRHAA